AEDGGRVTVDEAAVAGGQRRVGLAVDLGLRVGRDRQRGWGDGQAAAEEGGDGVVAGGRQRALGDGIVAHAAAAGRRGGQRPREGRGGVAVDQAAVGVRQGRVVLAVDLALAGGRDRQRGRGDGQAVAGEGDGVVAAGGQRALVDGVAAHVLARGPGQAAGQHRGGRVAELEAADGVGQGRIGA